MHHRCLCIVLLYIIQVFCQNDNNLSTELPTTTTNQEASNTKQENEDDLNLDPSHVEDADSAESDASKWVNMVLSESLNNKINHVKPTLTAMDDEDITNYLNLDVSDYEDDDVDDIDDRSNEMYLSRHGQFLNFTLTECYIFIAINLAMSCIGYPILRMYWQQKFRVAFVADHMSRKRFITLRSSIKIVNDNDLSDEDKRRNKLWKVRPLTQEIRKEKDICTTNENKTGKCVLYYQCDPDLRTIIEDGTTIIDFRSEVGSCPHYLQVCCILDKVIAVVGDTSSNKTDYLNTPSDSVEVQSKDSFREETNKCGWSNHALNIFQPKNKEIADNSPYSNYGDFPWMIALIRKLSESTVWSRKDYLGGGSLIQPGVVLTVAHKVMDIAAKDLKCRAGEWDTQTTYELFAHQERDVEKIITHPQYYRPSLYNDIGLLFLKSPFDLSQSPNIGLACIGTSMPPPGTKCFSMGWGKEFKEKNKYAVILKKVQVPLVSAPDCQLLLRNTRLGQFFVLHNSLTCAGGEVGVDTCLRDGGSSLVCPVQTLGENTRFAVFGMVAYGISCGKMNSPGVYVNVPHLKSWLDTTIANEGYTLDLYTYSE